PRRSCICLKLRRLMPTGEVSRLRFQVSSLMLLGERPSSGAAMLKYPVRAGFAQCGTMAVAAAEDGRIPPKGCVCEPNYHFDSFCGQCMLSRLFLIWEN